PAVRPAGALRAKVDLHVFGQDVNAREALVRRVARLRDGDRIAQELERLGERVIGADDALIRQETAAQAEGREGQCTAGVLLFGQAGQVCRKANLRLDLFLAVAE